MRMHELRKLAKMTAELSEMELILSTLKEYHAAIEGVIEDIPDTISDVSDDINEVERSLEELRRSISEEREKTEQFISLIPDGRTQIYMRLHYLKGLSWEDVATVTDTKSAGVVRERVAQGLRYLRGTDNGEQVELSTTDMSEFAALSTALSRKEMTLAAVRKHISGSGYSDDVSNDDVLALEFEISELRCRRDGRLADVECFLETVDIPIVGLYMRLHFIKGLAWKEVSDITGAKSGNAARTRVLRYMKARGLDRQAEDSVAAQLKTKGR